MAVEIRLSAAEVARVRFAVSPMAETVLGVRLAVRTDDHPVHQRWIRDARRWLAQERESALLTALLAGPVPSFLLPVPLRRIPDFTAEVQHLRTTDPAFFRSELAAAGVSEQRLARLPADSHRALDRIAAALDRAHEALVEKHWGRMRAVLDADVATRALALVDRGVEGLFADLHRDVAWREGRLTVHGRRGADNACAVDTSGSGLVLMPTVFSWPEILVDCSPRPTASIRYPATGIGLLWSQPSAGCRELTPVLGRARAALLDVLGEPLTTGQLAARLGVTPSAVSQHLAALRGAGLVVTRREGRNALHLRTEGGALLVAGVTG